MDRPPHRGLLLAIFFLSGACALTYQIVWIRLLNLAFGATTFAMAVVLAIFMGGLGLGSLLAARFAHRVRSPVVAYAWLEGLIGVVGLAVPGVIRAVDRLQASVLDVDSAWPVVLAWQVLGCALPLLVPTTAMGATLPILSRWIARDERTRGRDLGLLYALNTLGALAGVVYAGFFAIEHLGVTGTNRSAVVVNLLIAGAALRLGRTAVPVEAPNRGPTPRGLLGLAAMAGFLGLAHEVVWTRLLGLLLINTTYTYSLILAVVIGGIGVGSLLGGRWADRARDPVLLFGQLQGVVGLGALGVFPLLVGVLALAPGLLVAHDLEFGRWQLVSSTLCVGMLSIPAVAMGAAFPALAKAITSQGEDVDRQVGRLYVANTFAGVVGSLAAGFGLLPLLGVLGSVQLLCAGNLVVLLWLMRRATSPGGRALGIGILVASVLLFGLAGSRVDLEDLYQARLPAGSTILHLDESATSTVMVADHSDPPVRRIWIQSVWVAGTGGGHRMLGHLAMLHSPTLERGVGIAFGTGQSFASARLHGLERLDCVDLNEEMVRAGGEWFADHNDRITEQDGVRVIIADGRSMLARSDVVYDALLMEPLQPWYAGAVNLYTREFYELAHARLRDGGTITQWMPLDDQPAETTRAVVATLASVFPNSRLYLDNFDLWIVGTKGGGTQPLSRWHERTTRPAVAEDLAGIDYGDVPSILATLLVGPADLPEYVAGARLLTDDHPFMEFEAPRTMHGRHYAGNVAALVAACREPLAGFTGAGGASAPPGLEDCRVGAALAESLVASDQGRLDEAMALAERAVELASIGRTRAAVRSAASALGSQQARSGDLAGAEGTWERLTRASPEFGGGWLNLGIAQIRRGDVAGARQSFAEAARDPAFAERAAQALALLPSP